MGAGGLMTAMVPAGQGDFYGIRQRCVMDATSLARTSKERVRGLARAAGRGLGMLPGSSRVFGPPRRFYATLEEWAAAEGGRGANRLISLNPARPEQRPVPAVAD